MDVNLPNEKKKEKKKNEISKHKMSLNLAGQDKRQQKDVLQKILLDPGLVW